MEEESLGIVAAAYELRSFNVGGDPRGYYNLRLPAAFSRRNRPGNALLFACISCGRDKLMVTDGSEIQLKQYLKTGIASHLFGTIGGKSSKVPR